MDDDGAGFTTAYMTDLNSDFDYKFFLQAPTSSDAIIRLRSRLIDRGVTDK